MPASSRTQYPMEDIGALLAQNGPKLFALALRLCGNRADAEDMVQDTFVQALRKWDTFRGDASRSTWLWAIAARSCKARMRRKGGVDRRMPPLSQLAPWGETTVMAVAAVPRGVDAAASAESIKRVQDAIAVLPEHFRLPILLKEVIGLSVEDVAAATGLAENTIKTRLHRGRLLLRKVMTDGARSITASAPIYERQVCLDLLRLKMEAMDDATPGKRSVIPQAEVCDRCRAVFQELEFVRDACAAMGEGMMPDSVRARIMELLRAEAQKRPHGQDKYGSRGARHGGGRRPRPMQGIRKT